MDKQREAALYFAEMSVAGLAMAFGALNEYARQSGGTTEEECPVVKVCKRGRPSAKLDHTKIAQFLAGLGKLKWSCPFCHKEFSDGWNVTNRSE